MSRIEGSAAWDVGGDSTRRRSAGWTAAAASASLLALAGLAALARLHPTIPWDAYQLLERDLLESRLAESILHLHSQPPLTNLLLAFVLRSSRLFGASPESWAFAIQLGVGLGLAIALAALAVRFVRSPILRGSLLVLVLADPMLQVSMYELFYSLHELAFVLFAALFLARFLDAGRLVDLSVYTASIVGLVLSRSLFHPLWGVVAIALPFAFGEGRRSAGRGGRIAVLAVASLVILAWPLKNLFLFGFFGTSSWQGYNLSRGLGIDMRPAPVLVTRLPGPVTPEIEALAATEVPEPFREIPALARPFKTSGWPNWNNAALVPWSEELGRRSIERLRSDPTSLGPKIARNYVAYCGFSGRHPYSGSLDWKAPSPGFRAWLRGYELLVFVPIAAPAAEGRWTGFALLFPVATILVILSLRRRWREDRASSGAILFMLFAILTVFVLVLVVDGYEGARIRWPTHAPFLLLVAWALDGFLRGRRGDSASTPAHQPTGSSGAGRAPTVYPDGER